MPGIGTFGRYLCQYQSGNDITIQANLASTNSEHWASMKQTIRMIIPVALLVIRMIILFIGMIIPSIRMIVLMVRFLGLLLMVTRIVLVMPVNEPLAQVSQVFKADRPTTCQTKLVGK